STVTWAWADREAARAKMATKATQTHFRGIRLSSQEIAILAERSAHRLYRFCQPLGRLRAGVDTAGGKMGGTPDVAARAAARLPQFVQKSAIDGVVPQNRCWWRRRQKIA